MSYCVLRLTLNLGTERLKVSSFDLNTFDTILLNLAESETLEVSLVVQKHSCLIDIMLQVEYPAYKWIALTGD